MSKNIKLNNTEYQGVSTVQLATTDNKTASFLDVDEMVIPTGTVEITKNGQIDVLNYAMANVNVAGGGSSYETGTFVGDGTHNVTLSVTSKKVGFIIMINDYDNIVENEITTLPEQTIFYEMYDSINGRYANQRSFNNAVTNGADILPETRRNKVIFDDTSITKTTIFSVSSETYAEGKTYTWIAW